MNLQNLKNNYAQEQGYEDWEEYVIKQFSFSKFSMTATISVFEKCMDEICIRAQKAALEKAFKNAFITCKKGEDYDCKQCYGGGCENPIVDKESITNHENLIR